MRRRLLLAVSIGLAAAASVAASAVPVHAYGAVCVRAKPGARLWPYNGDDCHSCCCRRPWRPEVGELAFRVQAQEGTYLHVRNWRFRGRILYHRVRLTDEDDCTAAGI